MDFASFGIASVACITVICYPVSYTHLDVYKRQVLGVKGSMSGSEGMKPQAKNVTPIFEQQVVLPDKAYNCLSQVCLLYTSRCV